MRRKKEGGGVKRTSCEAGAWQSCKGRDEPRRIWGKRCFKEPIRGEGVERADAVRKAKAGVDTQDGEAKSHHFLIRTLVRLGGRCIG